MSSGQKIVKIFAIILAVFIIGSICSAILTGIGILSEIEYWNEHDATSEDSKVNEMIQDIEQINELKENVKVKIDLMVSSLEIKEGSTFQVEKRNVSTNLVCRVTGNTLEVKEKSIKRLKNVDDKARIIIYIPKDINLNTLDISMGAGIAQIQNINTEKLNISAGAGRMVLNNITSDKTDIDGGAGSLTINNSTLNNLDLDCGVGVTKLTGDITGKSKISCGVGRTEIDLAQSKNNYTIQTETGLRSIRLNGEKCLDDEHYGSGENLIKIDGGVGSVEITTK